MHKYILKKNGPNKRLIKKIRQFAQQVFKEGPVESHLAFSSSPDDLIRLITNIFFLLILL